MAIFEALAPSFQVAFSLMARSLQETGKVVKSLGPASVAIETQVRFSHDKQNYAP
jgi:hypothetical protein